MLLVLHQLLIEFLLVQFERIEFSQDFDGHSQEEVQNGAQKSLKLKLNFFFNYKYHLTFIVFIKIYSNQNNKNVLKKAKISLIQI